MTPHERIDESLERYASMLVRKRPPRDSVKYPVWIREIQAHLWRINQHETETV